MNIWAQSMLLWSWQSLLIVGLVLVAAKVAPNRSAAARHSFWMLGILVIAALPAVNAAMPFLGWTPPAIAPITEVAQLPALAIEAIPSIAESPSVSNGDFVVRVVFWIWAIGVVFWIWAIGVVFCILRFLRTHYRWNRILGSARIIRGEIAVPLGYSSAIDVPVLVGIIRPTILLPAGIEDWTDSEERRAILLHELAHVERRDHWLNAFRAMLGAVFFFHPAVRYALRQLIVERELACDERALAAGASRRSYAEVILKVAERTIHGRRADCPAFDTSAEILERRIDMILTHQPSRQERHRLPSIARGALVLGCAALLLPNPSAATELPLAPAEIRFASMQPLMTEMIEEISLVARVITKEAEAEPAAGPAQPATTQVADGTVSGTVLDQSGAAVPGVRVTLTAAAGQRAVVTNETGRYVLPQVAPGQYSLQARLPGFRTVDRTVSVTAGTTSTHNVTLPLAGISTQVEISAKRVPVVQAAAPIPPPNPTALPVRIGGDVAQANLVNQVKPVYPPAALAAGIQDTVHLSAVIGTDGTILSLRLDQSRPNSGNAEFIRAATDAVQQWRYRPTVLNGQPVQTDTTITVNFSLVD